MTKSTKHYVHFKINGKLTADEYEQIKKLPYKEQVKALAARSQSIVATPDVADIIDGAEEAPTDLFESLDDNCDWRNGKPEGEDWSQGRPAVKRDPMFEPAEVGDADFD